MAEISGNAPTRLPDRASVEVVLAALPAGADEAALAAALTEKFPGFSFTATIIETSTGATCGQCSPSTAAASRSCGRG